MITRIITGIILAIVTTTLLLFNLWTKLALICITLLGLNWEINKITETKTITKVILFSLTTLICILGITHNLAHISLSIPAMIASLLLMSFILFELFKKNLWGIHSPTVFTLRTASLYIATFPYIFLAFQNPYFALTIICSLALTDSIAYFVGKAIGKTPLTPLSPKKTIEGSLAGLITTPISLIFCNTLFHTIPLSNGFLILLGIGISILSQMGDIHESLTKRLFNQKDSSQILPGHGGIYDRIDSYIFTIPATIIFLNFWALL